MAFSGRWLILLAVVALLSTSVYSQDDEDDDDVDMVDVDDMPGDKLAPSEDEEEKLEFKERPVYKKPVVMGTTYFTDSFESVEDFKKTWVISQARKEDVEEDIAKYDGKWSVEEAKNNPVIDDLGLVLKSRAKHHAISAKLDKPYEFTGNPFVVQYEVKFQNGQDCGGAYIKLLTEDSKLKLDNFMDKSAYTIMFGPDKCGNDNKLHFIFRHKSPVTGKFEEKHAKKPKSSLDTHFSDKRSHLYTLVVHPDNRFEVFVDQDIVNSGNLLEDVEPAVNPPQEIIDPTDKKPDGWDEREKIPDPEATKPEDWDETEPEMISDPSAVKPDGWLDNEPDLIPDPDAERQADWDEEMDGEWEPPMISNPICESAAGCGEWSAPQIKNPKYKGKWRPAMIENPDYKGKWKPKKIPNPDFFEDKQPYKMSPIGAIGLELWSMSDDIVFDNFIITDDKAVADQWAADTWEIKHMQELSGDGSGRSVVQAVMDATKERPWLWAVLIIVVILPIVLVIAYCCMPGSSKPADIAAHRKKTDQASEDDKEEDDEEEESKPKSAGDTPKTSKASKADLESEEAEADEADAEDEEVGEEEQEQTRTSPRKRKARARKD